MAPDNGPVTKDDLRQAIADIKGLILNEIRHVKEDTNANTQWRTEFMAEEGPWRKIHYRVEKLERLAWLFVGVAAFLSPVVIWAIIEIIKTLTGRP
jgi:hypothetical protein